MKKIISNHNVDKFRHGHSKYNRTSMKIYYRCLLKYRKKKIIPV